MKRFLSICARDVLGIADDSSLNPVFVLQAIEDRSLAQARKGLNMAVGDIVEMCHGRSPDYVSVLDRELAAQGAMTLSEARARFSKSLKKIIKRKQITTESEYYLVRNATDFATPESASDMWAMLAAFEKKSGVDG